MGGGRRASGGRGSTGRSPPLRYKTSVPRKRLKSRMFLKISGHLRYKICCSTNLLF